MSRPSISWPNVQVSYHFLSWFFNFVCKLLEILNIITQVTSYNQITDLNYSQQQNVLLWKFLEESVGHSNFSFAENCNFILLLIFSSHNLYSFPWQYNSPHPFAFFISTGNELKQFCSSVSVFVSSFNPLNFTIHWFYTLIPSLVSLWWILQHDSFILEKIGRSYPFFKLYLIPS